MGMYDYLNGEQVKIFFTAGIALPDNFSKNCVFFSGGSLDTFDDEVPYKTLVYNYGKNFNIIDFFPFEDEQGFVHIIRDGKNLGKKYFNELTNNDLIFENYNDHGYRLNIKTIDDIYNFINAQNNFMENYKKRKHEAFDNWSKYAREHKGDDDFKEKYKELYFLTKLEEQKNNEMLAPYLQEKNKFFLEDLIPEKYSIFGGLINGLSRPLIEEYISNNYKFVVNDDRLTFIIAYNEFKNMLSDENFVNEYFNLFEFDNKEKEIFTDFVKNIDKLYEQISTFVYSKDQFNEKYALEQIYSGKYKDYYLKYNILPFEGFDYNIWNNCKFDIKEQEYKDFENELNEYILKRFRDINDINR